MLAKRTFAVILLSLALCLAGFSQTSGSVVVLQTELTNIQDSWLSNHLQNLIEENLQKYTDFTTVVDEAAERKVKEQQRRSESTAHSESDIIEIGKLVNAKYALFSYARKAGNAYTLTIHFTNLTTGVQRASITSRQYGKLEELYAHPGAVDEVTLALCERLGIILSTAQKYVLQHGETELTINQQIELERKEQERFRQQMKDLDKQIIALKTSTEVDAETQQKKLEALRAMNEQKFKAAQEREKRLREDQKKRQADMVAEESRKKESIQRRNKMSAEIEIKVKNLRATKVQNANIMERIAFLETRKKTFNELQNELAKRKEEIDHAADEEFNLKKAEIEARPWRAAELADGEPTATAKERRNGEIESIMKKLKMQAEKEKFIVEKELQPTSRALLDEIITDYRNLENITVTISSIRNEKDVQYSIGTFNGDKNYWPVLLYFYNDGKESIGQYQTSISYQTVTGKKPFSEMSFYYNKEQEEEAYNDFLDTVDMYNSLFARTVPVLTYEVDYTVEPWTIPSQYRICFKKLRIKDTQSEKVLLNEDITDLDKIMSFSECEIQASYYAQIIPPNDKNIPGYLLYKFALEAKKNGNPAGISNLMRYAAEKKYTPALGYVERKEAEQSERQRMEAQAKAKEEKRKKDEKEKYKRRKAAARDALYDSPRLGFSLSGSFSPSVQNYAFEVKYFRNGKGEYVSIPFISLAQVFEGGYIGGGVNTWLRNGELDILCSYFLCGLSISLRRLRPYIELGGGIGSVNISKEGHFGLYGYVKGGLEVRISPHFSIDVFCKPQGSLYRINTIETYADEKTQEKAINCPAGTISGGVSVTFWKIFN